MGRYGTTTKYILEALIPDGGTYSKQRKKMLAYLEQEKGVNSRSLKVSFYRSIKSGLITIDDTDTVSLTDRGRRAIEPFIAPTLAGSVLMIVFDITEQQRKKRDHLRTLLKELSFEQIQKSVWVTKFDHRAYIQSEIRALKLEDSVILYEANRL